MPLMTELFNMKSDKKFGEISGMLDKFMSGEKGTTKGVLDGTEYIYGYVPISSTTERCGYHECNLLWCLSYLP